MAYARFQQLARELVELKGILNTLAWDQETMMPSRAATLRARQVETLTGMHHQKLVQPELVDLVQELSQSDLDPWQAASVAVLAREQHRALALPESLVREIAGTCSLAYEAWVEARQTSNFSFFAPWLEKVVSLKRREAHCLAQSGHLYDALLDHFEPHMTTGVLDPLFESLEGPLRSLLERTQVRSRSLGPVRGDFPLSEQERFGRQVLAAMGLDWSAGRLDRSPHPFCTGLTPLDVRITTRYDPHDFTVALFGMIHEAGHALYEQGLGVERYGSPALDAISLGVHESQSRLWENQVARSLDFWRFWYPRLQQAFPDPFRNLSLEEFLARINRVEASCIRVEADEVTYPLHVILRYRLEKELIEGRLEVEGLEEAWNDRMQELLGLTPPNAAQGVLQDTHWSQGLIGYFPTYLLGNLYAAQIFEQARKELPLQEQLSGGELKPLRRWLLEKIHRKGRTRTATQLIQEISGRPLDPECYLGYLEGKFGQVSGP